MNCLERYPEFRTSRREQTCVPFAQVDVRNLAAWIMAIPFADWPQQNGRPTIVCNPAWQGFGARTNAVVERLMAENFPGCTSTERMLSAVLPGRSIHQHTDQQGDNWFCRVHVPILSNTGAVLICDGEENVLEVGRAYMVNAERLHTIHNRGSTPRVHLIFDVVQGVWNHVRDA